MQKNQQTPEVPPIVENERELSIDMSEVPSVNTSETGHSGSSRLVTGSRQQRIGKYQILAELGRGGAANVSLAVTRGKGGVRKLVVLKALLPELAEEPGAVAAFLDEARLAAQLSHPNVVQTYEVGTESGRHVIVMEYLDGQSLSRITRTAQKACQDFPLAVQLRIIIEVLEGLHYAHEMKAYDGHLLRLVHRDVSPQNVIVTYDGQVKILDFGIAKAASSSTHTAAGIMKGKIAYMAPEQMVGTTVDRRADIYSAGCILWAAAAGQKLWQDLPDVQIVRAVVAGRIPSPNSANPRCDDELESIVMRSLSPDPEKRYTTAREFQNALEHYSERVEGATKPREIGRYVSQLFAALRLEFNESIERELAELLAADSAEDGRESIIELNDKRSIFPIPIPPQDESVQSASGVLTQPSRSRRHFMRIAVALVGLASIAVFLVAAPKAWRPTSPAVASLTRDVRAPEPTSSAAEPQVPSVAAIHLALSPVDARLILDGRTLEPGITELTLPIDQVNHEAIAEADGYSREVHSFKVTGPTTLTIALSPNVNHKLTKRAWHQAVGTNRVAPATAAPPAAATKPAAAACENPFFVDAQGIKRVRPGCL